MLFSHSLFHIIYQTTNLVNEKIYIGKHTTTNLNDGYMGSGKHIKRAIKKYGIENFEKEIILCAFTEDFAYEVEEELVTPEFVLREDTYNIVPGGKGGGKGKITPIETRRKISEGNIGKKDSEETKIKKSKSMSGKKKSVSHVNNVRKSVEKYLYTIKICDNKIETTTNLTQYCKERNINICTLRKGGTSKGCSILTKETKNIKSGEEGYVFWENSLHPKKKRGTSNKYIYSIQTPDGNIETATNLNRYCKERSLNQGNICSNGKSRGYLVISKTLRPT